MKQLSKIMLAAVASVALAAPAFAWDFSASGSATAYFNQTSSKANNEATTKESTASNGFSSAGASLTLASSHTDGPNTTSFTYVLDNDGNLDENLTVSGSRKVGDWTASGSVSYTPNRLGCSNAASSTTDNITSGAVACPDPQANTEDSTSVTLTNGTMTIVMGDATHLSSQNVSSGSTASGQDGMDAQGSDCDVGACVDDFEGVSLGYALSDTMSVTVAYQQEPNALAMGTGEALDGEAAAGVTVTGFGLSFSGTFGPATIGVTQASASSADATGDDDAGKLSSSWSTMGLGLAIDLGDIDPFISFGTATGSAGSAANKTVEHTHSGNEVGLTYALGSDTITLLVGSMENQFDTASTVDKPETTSIMEVGYATMIGPASLSIGYGTSAKADADKGTSADGYSMSDLDVALSISF